MGKVENDIEYTIKLENGESIENYDRLYFSSNENLNFLFKQFNIKDKDVLCVLASSDQLFYSYLNGAKNVDSFDINKLTFYYYYLRKWCIEYIDSYYPDEKVSNEFIYNLLKNVKVKSYDEEEAYNYWDTYIKTVYGCMTKNLFYMSSYIDLNRVRDVSSLKEIIKNRELSFKNIDISSDDLDIDKKYDVIITSNLSEYFYDNVLKINRYKNNLNNLLKDDGIIISSLIFTNYISSVEKKIFKDDYDIDIFPFYRDSWGLCASGYSYTKKMSTKKC